MHSLQVSAYSKAKGNALKFSGAMYLLTMAWTLCVDNEELLNFKGTLAELEAIIQPLLLSILATNDARGGDIDAESMKRGIVWATYFMEQQALHAPRRLHRRTAARLLRTRPHLCACACSSRCRTR